MPAIGYVTKSTDGTYTGQLNTLTIKANIEIVPNTAKASESQPDFRITSDSVDIGAGWNCHSEASGRDYVSLSFAAPEFGSRRLYANLGRAAGNDDSKFAILWNPAD
ncbi:MAG: DUF736 family protein [Pseudomonadota bacterium]